MIGGKVYRVQQRNAHGDPVDDDGNVVRNGSYLGKVDVIVGNQSVNPVNARGNVVSTEGQIGIPTYSPITLKHDDVVALEDGRQLRVEGPQLWGRPHSLTGSPARFAWWRAVALHN